MFEVRELLERVIKIFAEKYDFGEYKVEERNGGYLVEVKSKLGDYKLSFFITLSQRTQYLILNWIKWDASIMKTIDEAKLYVYDLFELFTALDYIFTWVSLGYISVGDIDENIYRRAIEKGSFE